MEKIRLQKFFTDCGVLSRRAAEDEIRAGGFGMMLSDALCRAGALDGHPYTILATTDGFVTQDKPEPIYRTAGVDAAAMVEELRGLLGK